MFASNHQISLRQLYRLFVFDLIGVSTLVLPSRLAYLSASDGLLGILIGGILASLYLWYLGWILKEMKTDFISFCMNRLPGWLGRIIFLFLAANAIGLAAFGAYVFTDVMRYGLLPRESYGLILFIILLVSSYSVQSGMESRARIYEMVFVVLAIALGVLLLLAAFDMQRDYIGPFFTSSPGNVVKGGLLEFLCFIPLFAVLFFPAYVKNTGDKRLVMTVFKALWSAVGILFVLYLILLGSFGSGALMTMRYPAVTLMSNIQLKSSFFQRFDAFMLGIWFFTLFALVNLFLFYGANLLQQTFTPGKRTVIYVVLTAVLIFLLALLFRQSDWLTLFFSYFCYLGMPLLLLLPGLVLLIGKGGKVNKKVLVLIPFLLFFLGGCSATELEERCFPMAVLTDYRLGQVEVSYIFPALSQKENTDVEEAKVDAAMSKGDSFEEALLRFEEQLDKKVDTNHIKVLILGREELDCKNSYEDMLLYLQATGKIPRNALVCVADDLPGLLEIQEDLPTDLGSYVEQFLMNHEEEKNMELVNVGRLIDEGQNHKKTLKLPCLYVRDGAIVWDGFYLAEHV